MPRGIRKLDYKTEVYSNGPVFDVPVIEESEFDFDEMVTVVRNSPKSNW
jgi:hypothetical protein